MGPRCCRDGCERTDATLHLFTGAVTGKVSTDAVYTGGSFCSWQHLRDWLVLTAPADRMGVPWDPAVAAP